MSIRTKSRRLGRATAVATVLASAAHAAAAPPDVLPRSMILERLPADAIEVGEAMKRAKVGEEIILRGRITDGTDVFVSNRAMFRLADESAVPACCASHGPAPATGAAACSVPAEKRATIQFLDARGRLIGTGLQGRHGLTVGREVFVVGKVHQADNDKVLIVTATGLHVPEADVPFGLMLDRAPENALDVADAKAAATPGAAVVIRGRIGGSMKPFVDGRAVFTIVGQGPKACSDIPGDACRTPWDYCCVPRPEILANAATIQVVDAANVPIRTDIRGRRGIRELSEVTVVGTVVTSERGALIVKATGIHVHDGREAPRDDRAP